MNKIQLQTVFFKQLKSLHDVELHFDKCLTAIMGTNGSGKTTVIHALACIYKPDDDGKGEDHRFPEFFVPNTDALWTGSEFQVVNAIDAKKKGMESQPCRHYAKQYDRWAPRYVNRPKRNVYYIGIDTCLPEIEKNNRTSHIHYVSLERSDKLSQQVLTRAAYILNKEYETLLDNAYNNHHFLGVSTRSGLRYSSLSMGTGEQRTIKILEKVMKAEPYSLVLIDEIDLLLHISALRRLVKTLHEIATSKYLQIVFTTHSMEVLRLNDLIGLQYLHTVKKSDGSNAIFVYDEPNDDIIRDLSGESVQPLKIYVEDVFSQTIVKHLVRKHNLSRKTSIVKFGAAHNAFSLAAGFVIANQCIANVLILLDGDEYNTTDAKDAQIKKALSGSEDDITQRQSQALSIIKEYNLPESKSPEEFFHELVLLCGTDNEIVQLAREINSVADKHQFINYICEQLHENVEIVLTQIIGMIEALPQWLTYIAPIDNWLQEHGNV